MLKHTIDQFKNSTEESDRLALDLFGSGAYPPTIPSTIVEIDMRSEIVADGAKRRANSDSAKKRRIELTLQLYEAFRDELNEATFLKRIRIRQKIRTKVRDVIREEFAQGNEHLNLIARL